MADPQNNEIDTGGMFASKLHRLVNDPVLDIVGACPSCGAPIYGHKTIRVGDDRTPVRRTCDCTDHRKCLMETK